MITASPTSHSYISQRLKLHYVDWGNPQAPPLLLLHGGRDDIAGIADRIWYPVWDSGAELDHAVRTVPQARRVARADRPAGVRG